MTYDDLEETALDGTTLRLEKHGDGVRVLTLDDPARHNALSLAMRDELLAAAAALKADGEARALVVTGAGPSFCSGADLGELFGGGLDVGDLRARLKSVYAGFLALRDLEIPTIAAVRGHAIGAGLNLAMCCDLRLASRTAKFSATFSRIGLHPGGGATYFLVQALGKQRALAMLLEGGTYAGEDAVRHGLALSLHEDPLPEALALAHRIAALPPGLAEDIKAAVALTDDGLAATVGFEAWAQASAGTRPAAQDVIAARAAKR
ncbi:enoyl-CoA hydratase-related protein [Actinocorallia sp. API 0066]|uniref:enoyl-CoA hydratase-related protein n=1 Tax=Actinocorallia sp. API 0066 TaxID=2896846 RepID=UPI001E6141F0|nr:enoyl-CoA hydratase-related protein [Actinocorallia sp. API 0066]MCD0449987.1 enoyl-CoA hydratase-related protein [Actinocorallia sp. API 0066]